MEDDLALQQSVAAELAWEPAVDAGHIDVTVRCGVVTLLGHVKSFSEELAAEAAARRVRGVHGIAEELRVELPAEDQRSDEDIALSIHTVLRWHVGIPLDAVGVAVERRHVTLRGAVPWQYQKELAAKETHHIRGVRGLTNQITIRSGVVPGDIAQRIADALKRHAELDAANINVTSKGNEVTLTGHVMTGHERSIAVKAAWSAPGVSHVKDEISLAV